MKSKNRIVAKAHPRATWRDPPGYKLYVMLYEKAWWENMTRTPLSDCLTLAARNANSNSGARNCGTPTRVCPSELLGFTRVYN